MSHIAWTDGIGAASLSNAKCGLYEIRNTVTGGFYIGTSVDMVRRFAQHIQTLRIGTHKNPSLLRAARENGSDVFTFRVLAILERDQLIHTESRLLRRVVGTPGCYNCSFGAGGGHMRGKHHSAEMKARISVWTSRPRGPKSAEHRAKIAAALRGRPLPAGMLEKAIAANRGRRHSPEHIEKQRLSQLGRQHTPEAKAKMSAAKKGKPLTPEHIAKVIATRIGKKHRPETIQKMRAASLRRQRTAAGVFV